MLILSPDEIRSAELFAAKNGVSLMTLMRRAGKACFDEITGYISEEKSARFAGKTPKIAVLCGMGNNGGDGFICAALLKKAGLDTTVLALYGPPRTENASKAFDELKNTDAEIIDLNIDPRFDTEKLISSCDIIVDAIFGIGFKDREDPVFERIAKAVNKSSGAVFAVDIPSGVSCDGIIHKNAVKADMTVTFQYMKKAFISNDSADFCGKVVCADIGIPKDATAHFEKLCIITEENEIKPLITKRDGDVNKGDFGRALLVCGSYGMAGAAILAARAAMLCGVGIAELFIPESIYEICAAAVTECVFTTYDPDDISGAVRLLKKRIKKASAVAVGCGLSVSDTAKALTFAALESAKCPLVIDADGINCISEHIDILKTADADILLTPHPGEMGRLIKKSADFANSDRIGISTAFAEKYGLTLLLKGRFTVIAAPDGTVHINTTGNAGMAKAGSGDVLTGIALSLAAQGIPLCSAASAAAFIHGKAGDIAAKEHSRRAMTASDTASSLKKLFSEYEKD